MNFLCNNESVYKFFYGFNKTIIWVSASPNIKIIGQGSVILYGQYDVTLPNDFDIGLNLAR